MMFVLAASLGSAEEEQYIAGLSISLEGAPDHVYTGQTFTMSVRVVNQSGQAVTGRLRTYLYASIEEVQYPPPSEGFTYVPVNEGE